MSDIRSPASPAPAPAEAGEPTSGAAGPSQVAESAKSQATSVVESGKSEAREIASDATDHARQLAGDAREHLRSQASEQTARLGSSIRSLSEQMDGALRARRLRARSRTCSARPPTAHSRWHSRLSATPTAARGSAPIRPPAARCVPRRGSGTGLRDRQVPASHQHVFTRRRRQDWRQARRGIRRQSRQRGRRPASGRADSTERPA